MGRVGAEEHIASTAVAADVPFSFKVESLSKVPVDQTTRGLRCSIALYHGSQLLCPVMKTDLVQPRTLTTSVKTLSGASEASTRGRGER